MKRQRVGALEVHLPEPVRRRAQEELRFTAEPSAGLDAHRLTPERTCGAVTSNRCRVTGSRCGRDGSLSHLLVLLLVVVMINLGFWQLRRLHERKTYNASVRANESQPAQPVEDVLHPGDPVSVGHDLNFRRVAATGTYDTSNEIIVRARSLNETPGVWALTPLRLADGTGVVVLRGFLPSQGTLERVLPMPSRRRSRCRSPASCRRPRPEARSARPIRRTDTSTTMARADVARIAKQLPYPILPAYVQLQTQQPPQPGPQPTASCPSRRSTKDRTSATRPVVHLHDHRHRRISIDPAPQGPRQGQGRRRRRDRGSGSGSGRRRKQPLGAK